MTDMTEFFKMASEVACGRRRCDEGHAYVSGTGRPLGETSIIGDVVIRAIYGEPGYYYKMNRWDETSEGWRYRDHLDLDV